MTGPLSYIGGKNRIANKIVSLLPPHKTYVEPFAGGAQVFFHKEPSEVEILNDLDGEIINFFRVCQHHHQELIRYLHFAVVSRKWFEWLGSTPNQALTDIQRAGKFLYMQKNAFGGLIVRQSFARHIIQPPPLNPSRIPEQIENTHRRLQNVQLECMPYEKILERCDRLTTLFYLDPPYFARSLYKFNLSEEDFLKLAERLRHIKGKFLLSLNDMPEVRKIFRGFSMSGFEMAYSAQKKAGRRYRELLIKNY